LSEEFFTDVTTLRARARQHIERGAVTKGYKGQLDVVLRLLNEALATEIVCVLRYRRHHFMATGIHAQAVAAEFLEHAERSKYATRSPLASCSSGAPDFDPRGYTHAAIRAWPCEPDGLPRDLVAERTRLELLRDYFATSAI
jgi:bacterioferritin